MSGPFCNQRTSYRPCIAPLEDRLRALERLEQLSNGTGGLCRINPGIIAAHHQHEQDLEALQQDSDHLVNSKNSLQVEDFKTGNDRFEQTNFDPSETQEGSSILDHAQRYHTFLHQQSQAKKLKENWDKVLPSLLSAYLLLKSETRNWTNSDWTNDMTGLFRACEPTSCHYRTVDMIDMNLSEYESLGRS